MVLNKNANSQLPSSNVSSGDRNLIKTFTILLRSHSMIAWKRWVGENICFCSRSGYENCPSRGVVGQKMAKFGPRSCWMRPYSTDHKKCIFLIFSVTADSFKQSLFVNIILETKYLLIWNKPKIVNLTNFLKSTSERFR